MVSIRLLTYSRRTHLFGVLEVLEEGLLVPGDTLVDVGGGVGEALGLTRLAAEDTERNPVSRCPPPVLVVALTREG